MKKTACIFVSLLIVFTMSGCITIHLPAKPTPVSNSFATPEPTLQPQISPSTTAAAEPSAAPSPDATAAPESDLYSSYAHMISLDVARGIADFDYFEILKGSDAVQWLVEQEGYSQADAEAEVADYADSEFIEKNTNPQIRQIDLTEIPLKLMYLPDGSQVEGAQAVDADYADMYALYELDPSLVTDTFFYYITAENGEAVSVEQVYWP